MEAAQARKTENIAKTAHAPSDKTLRAEPKTNSGATMGMPMFLQRSTATPTSLIHNQADTDRADHSDQEVEASTLAEEEIQSKPDPQLSQSLIQRKCAACELEEESNTAVESTNDEDNVQPRLTVGKADDAYEREADLIAERVVDSTQSSSAHLPTQSQPLTKSITPLGHRQTAGIQTKCDACDEEETSPPLQRKSAIQKRNNDTLGASHKVSSQLQQTQKNSGHRLSKSVRPTLESSFGADFSDVRIHSDHNAAELAEQLGAQAFTHGNDIYFNSGKYNPNDKEGVRLLAHELTHTIQQGATSNGQVQPTLIQRDTECKTEEKKGSKEQAEKAKTAPNTGECHETNPPVAAPPEGTEAPAKQETPAEIDAREGAPVDERQSKAPPVNENAPEREENPDASTEDAEATPQNPCEVRAAAGAKKQESERGSNTTSVQSSAVLNSVDISSEETTETQPGESQTDQTNNGEDDFLIAAAQTVDVLPEGLGENASPDVVDERNQLTVTAEERQVSLQSSSDLAAQMTSENIAYARSEERDGYNDQQSKQNHRQSSDLASAFLNRGGQHVLDFIRHGLAVAKELRGTTANKKETLSGRIQQLRNNTQSRILELQATADTEAKAAKQQVNESHSDVLSEIEAQALDAKTQVSVVYDEKLQQLKLAQIEEIPLLEVAYKTGYDRLIQIGHEKGNQSVQRAHQHERAYRNAENASASKQRLVRNRKKDGFWDGYLTYNRYMARADAAQEVGKQYKEGFKKEAKAQADNMMCGKPQDVELITTIGNQGVESLGCAYDNAVDAIEAQRLAAISQANKARQESLQKIRKSLTATLAQLKQREAGQLGLLKDYGERQSVALERDTEHAIGAMLQGVNDGARKLLQYLDQFSAQVESSESPPLETLSVELSREDARFAMSLGTAKTDLKFAAGNTQTSLNDGETKADTALEQLYQGGIDDAEALTNGFSTATANLVTGTLSGYDQVSNTFAAGMVAEIDNSTQILDGVYTGTRSVFKRINTGIKGKFQEVAAPMEQGMQQSLNKDLDTTVCAEAEKAAANIHPWWKDVLKVLLIIVVIAVVALVIGPAVIGAVGAAVTALAGSLGAGAALAGAIGAWVGPIIGGAIVGAIAGAAIQIGSNAIYGKKWDEGLWKAVIAGAIGGALGGLGGQLGQLLVGRIASTAFSRFAVQYGTDVVFDIAGGILGDLAAGNPVTWEGIVLGLAIGGSVQISMGGLGGLASRSRAARTQPRAAGGSDSFVGRLAQGRIGRAAERLSDLQGRSMSAGERLGARAGGFGPKAPTAEATSAALANARSRIESGEAFSTRGRNPEGWPTRPAEVGEPTPKTQDTATKPEDITTKANDDEGVRILIGGEEHTLSVRRVGDRRRLILCSNQCGEVLLKVRRLQSLVEPDSPAWLELEGLAKQAIDADTTVNSVTPRSDDSAVRAADKALEGLRDKMLDIHSRYPDLIDPNIPAAPRTEAGQSSTGKRINLADHLPSTAKTASGGEQVTLDLSTSPDFSKLQGLGSDVEFLYVVRDKVTGEILKVGSTADIETRAKRYTTVGDRHTMGRSLAMDVIPVAIKTKAHPTAESIEKLLRSSVETGISQQRGGTPAPDDAPILPWDLTDRRIPGEPAGPGTPGVRGRGSSGGDTRTLPNPPGPDDPPLKPGDQYWWRERKWTAEDGTAPSAPRSLPEWAAKLAGGDSANEALANARLGELLRNHPQREVARQLGISRGALRSYIRTRNLTPDDLKALPPP